MTGPLISAPELRSLLRRQAGPSPAVLDVRYRMGGPSGPGEYAAGHVPGASYVDLDRDLADPPGRGGRHPLPDVAVFEAAMRRVGVSGTRPVIVYDDWSGYGLSFLDEKRKIIPQVQEILKIIAANDLVLASGHYP